MGTRHVGERKVRHEVLMFVYRSSANPIVLMLACAGANCTRLQLDGKVHIECGQDAKHRHAPPPPPVASLARKQRQIRQRRTTRIVRRRSRQMNQTADVERVLQVEGDIGEHAGELFLHQLGGGERTIELLAV